MNICVCIAREGLRAMRSRKAKILCNAAGGLTMKYELKADQGLPSSILWLMTVGAGLVVANLYYNQPLLGMISRDFNVPESVAGRIAMLTQIGYALGLLLIVPLGDMFKRRPIILSSFLLLIISLAAMAISPMIEIALAASLLIGLCSVLPQIFVPIAAQLSTPQTKGKNIGIVMSGLLTGILASRVVSGFVGEIWGWREMYYIVAGVMLLYGALVAWKLPDLEPSFHGGYGTLMGSLARYFRILSPLRLAAMYGALIFASFLSFWTTLVFHLEKEPFYAGSDVVGLLGLVGIGGALVASLAGRYAHKVGEHLLIRIGMTLMLAGWAIFYFAGWSYPGLIIGICALDIGAQSIQVTNQTIIFSLSPEAANRVNTVYMTIFFIGGALGTFIGGKAWEAFGWDGVSAVGASFAGIALLLHFVFGSGRRNK